LIICNIDWIASKKGRYYVEYFAGAGMDGWKGDKTVCMRSAAAAQALFFIQYCPLLLQMKIYSHELFFAVGTSMTISATSKLGLH